MKKWFNCCFPSSKTEVGIKDNQVVEYKEEQNHIDNITQSKGNQESSLNENEKADPEKVKAHKKEENVSNSDLLNNNINEDNIKEQEDKKNDPAIEIISSSREITQEEINTAPILIIEEEQNGNLFRKQQLKINAGGLIGGRNAKDGISIFGKTEENENFKIDYGLNYNENINYPYFFSIYYQKEIKSYFIRAFLGKNSDFKILFIKLTNNYNLPLKQREIISAGNMIFEINPKGDNGVEIANLSQKESGKKVFYPTDKKDITIGRESKCDFAFPEDKSFSRVQATISYIEETKMWTIFDGSKLKQSTNGTWVFGTHSFIIKDQMCVEILNSKVKFILVPN